jgi:16S rRNA (guanine966-N2)-methyltransferase
MRVIAGKFRGRPLRTPPGETTRPIPDRVKESLFSMLGHRFGTAGALPELDVLDLFAGSGALGIESLSRGARSCLFVESSRRTLQVLRANLRALGLTEVTRVSAENAWAMRIPPAAGAGFGLVFVDPPYADVKDPTRVLDLLERLAARVASDGLLVLRHAAKTRFPRERFSNVTCCDERTFGTARVLLLSTQLKQSQVPSE